MTTSHRRERLIRLSDAEVRDVLAGASVLRRPLIDPPSAHPEGRWTFCVSSTDRRQEGEFAWGVPDPAGDTFTERGRERQVAYRCPFGLTGDALWASEAWRYANWTEDGEPWIGYRADGAVDLRGPRDEFEGEDWAGRLEEAWVSLSDPENYAIDNTAADRRWRPSVVMPRWASRIELTITGVRIERYPVTGAAAVEGAWTWVIAFERRVAEDASKSILAPASLCAQ